MFRSPIKEINAEFPAEDKFLDSIQRVVRESCASAGMPRKDTSAVLLAIEEGATNIIRHAYLYDKGTLRVRITVFRKLITFSLIDFGRSFRPKGGGKLDLDRLVESGRRGGLGFYMIQKIMDTVEYVSWAGQNELRMTKRLGRDRDPATPPLFRRMLSLRVKFSLWTFLNVSLVILGVFYFIHIRMTDEIYLQIDGQARALGENIAQQSALHIINHRSDAEFVELVEGAKDPLSCVVLTDLDGIILAHSDDIGKMRTVYKAPEYVVPDSIGYPQRAVVDGREINCLKLPILSGMRKLGMVHLTYTSETITERLEESRRLILLVAAGLVLIGVMGLYLQSNYFVKPIVNITRRVRRFTKGDLESELPLEGAAEFFEISSAFNEMMTRLRRDRDSLVERERLAKEIEVASEIQKTLLPRRLPDLPGLDIDAFYRAASVIGGDLYDVFQIDSERCCLIVADVSGKGVPASLVMSMLRTVMKIHSRQGVAAKDILISVNDYLTENIPRGMFITVLMGIYQVTNRQLSLVSAGHNPLLVYRADTRKISRLNPSGMPLGVPPTPQARFEDAVEEIDLQFNEGDAFIFYTDGITEAINRDGEQYGLARLEQFLGERWNKESGEPLSVLTRDLIEEIDSFAGYAAQRDDITFILGRMRTAEEPEKSGEESTEDAVDRQTLDDTQPED